MMRRVKPIFRSSLNQKLTMLIRVTSTREVRVKLFSLDVFSGNYYGARLKVLILKKIIKK